MSYDVSKVSEYIWTEVALFCGLLEVLHLERVCVSNMFTRLNRIYLRFRHSSGYIAFMRWSNMKHLIYLATLASAPSLCLNYADLSVPGGKCIYTHKPKIIKQSDNRTQPEEYAYSVDCFGYDMQENGDVRVITVGDSPGRTNSSSTTFASLEVFQISPQMKPPRRLYNRSREIPFDSFGKFVIARLCGDVLAAYRRNCLFLMFWREERSVAIVKEESEGNSIVVIQLSSVHAILPRATKTSKTLTLDAVPHTKCFVPSKHDWDKKHEKTSVCNFHWKSEAERKSKGITITVSQTGETSHTSGNFSRSYTNSIALMAFQKHCHRLAQH
ncbi:hypothetical protein DFH11DRAFT_1551549 [Phellopilus nigrolimitatus]|nr:hypothetical protein DFH11DRAFT_1551549 [Phellopilus nigrolimitatus]